MAQILLSNGAAQATPAAGAISVYSKTTDKRLYYKDDAGVEQGPIVTSVGQATQNANLVYAGPASGAAAQPTFRGIVYPDFSTVTFVDVYGSAQSLTGGSFTALVFSTVVTDNLAEYNTTTGTFTPQQTGYYDIFHSSESVTTNTDQRILVSVTPTSAADGPRIMQQYTNSGAGNNVSGSRILKLTGGTAYYFNCYVGTTEVLTNSLATALSIRRIG